MHIRRPDPAFIVTFETDDLWWLEEAFADDPETRKELKARVNDGDTLAWCTVHVTAEYGPFEATAYLGGCSFTDEDDFYRSREFEELKEEATSLLHQNMMKAYSVLQSLEEPDAYDLE